VAAAVQKASDAFPVKNTQTNGEAIESTISIEPLPSHTPTPIVLAVEAPVDDTLQIEPLPAQETKSQEEKQPARTPMAFSESRVCQHGQYCPYLKYSTENILGPEQKIPIRLCLVAETETREASYVNNLQACPKRFWKRYKDSEVVTSIVLMPDFYAFNRQATRR